MKKFVLFLISALVFSNACAAADVGEKAGKGVGKLIQGVTDVATSPGELVTQIPASMEDKDYLTGFIVSLVRGSVFGLARAGTGIYEVVTFPFPGKNGYGPILKPGSIFDKAVDTTISQTISS